MVNASGLQSFTRRCWQYHPFLNFGLWPHVKITRTQLTEEVWPGSNIAEPGLQVSAHSLMVVTGKELLQPPILGLQWRSNNVLLAVSSGDISGGCGKGLARSMTVYWLINSGSILDGMVRWLEGPSTIFKPIWNMVSSKCAWSIEYVSCMNIHERHIADQAFSYQTDYKMRSRDVFVTL